VYEIALTVEACLRAGTQVDVAWAVQSQGFSSVDWSEALAITPGGGRVGTVMSGSLNEQLADLATQGKTGRLVRVRASDVDALVVGLSCGGDATCLLLPASDLPADLWQRLRDREPVALVTRMDGEKVVGTDLFTAETVELAGEDVAQLFGRAASAATVTDDAVVTVLWPVPKLVIVGSGAIADALTASADLLGWRTQITTEAPTATGLVAGLATLDKLVVLSHDDELAGPVLAAALKGTVGYIGALGSRRTQQARADWLAYRGVTDLSRVHGPAGLAIGANTPAEIAVSIVAEALAVRAGSAAGSLREQPGPIRQM
jgi:xanthine dehydrogenase accessory factor